MSDANNYERLSDHIDDDNEYAGDNIITDGNMMSCANSIQVEAENEETDSKKQKTVRKEVKPRSVVWQWFTKIPGKLHECKCNFCHKVFSCGTAGGTTHLKRHIESGKCTIYNGLHRKSTQSQIHYQTSTTGSGSVDVVTWKFDQERSRRDLSELIIWRELPFNFVEDVKFRKFVKNLVPQYKFVSRITTRQDCMKRFEEEKNIVCKFLKEKSNRLCLTTDTWTSQNELPFMAVTAHFIDNEWKLQKRILNFTLTPLKASGQNLADLLSSCLECWGIEKIFTITTDNHTANDTFISSFIEIYESRNDALVHSGDLLQVRCWAHVLNLIVQDGLLEIKDSIARVRNAVKYVKASPKRKLEFLQYADQEHIPRTTMLVLDVCTRWNSTCKMLGSALHYVKAYNRMKARDPNFKDPPTQDDWKKAKVIYEFLGVFFTITELFSGTRYCTAHLFFSEVYKILVLLRETAKETDSLLRGTSFKMLEKFEKYWTTKPPNVLLSIAVVLDPRCKIKYLKFCYNTIYAPVEAIERMAIVENWLNRLFNEYLAKHDVSHQAHSISMKRKSKEGSSSSSTLIRKPKVWKDFQSYANDEETCDNKRELDLYLEEKLHRTENEDEDEIDNFDILAWWKVNASKYPVLAMMARDILAIPVSSVASESAFSTGGRVLSKFRSSLLPSTVEALICTQDWIRESALPYDDELELDLEFQDISLLEKGSK